MEEAEKIAFYHEQISEKMNLEKRQRSELLDMIASAENLADHAANKDMHFTAITLLSTASRLNRKLILDLLKQ